MKISVAVFYLFFLFFFFFGGGGHFLIGQIILVVSNVNYWSWYLDESYPNTQQNRH